jgi:hypothetical protein
MDLILGELSISEEASNMLLGRINDGHMHASYMSVVLFEKGEWNSLFEFCNSNPINVEDVAASFYEAIVWFNQSQQADMH